MRYGLIGETLKHSFSPKIHGAFGIQDYSIKEIPKECLDSFLQEKDFCGINVTIPYKESVIPYCIQDETSKAIGSVNTVVNREGVLYAYNTDCLGFAYMIHRAGISFTNKKVIILGSGGTAKTAVYVAKQEKSAEIVLVSRQKEAKASVFADVKIVDYSDVSAYADGAVLVNTTPLGMYPKVENTPVSLEVFHHLEAVVDVVYNPLCTMLTLQAKKKNIAYTNGLSMLVAQAYFAQRHFYGEEPVLKEEDRPVLEEIIAGMEAEARNIVLIGMPGCGKTTVGKALAERLQRTFVDTDDVFCERMGMTAGAYIEAKGEQAFRDAESDIVKEFAKEKGLVIATGGGSILREENRDSLRLNSKIVFLERELCKLATDGRPLSGDLDRMQKLYEMRYPIYAGLADISVAVGEDLEVILRKITEEV